MKYKRLGKQRYEVWAADITIKQHANQLMCKV